MPINYKEYPANWKTEIRPAVMKRAGEVRDATGTIIQEAKCEGCGVLNHAKGARNFKGEWMDEDRINGLNSDSGEFMFQHLNGAFPSITTIVLTVAHLDHDKTNKDVSIDRLRAWCQKCHLGYDMPQHIEKRKNSLKKKKGIIELFDAPEEVENIIRALWWKQPFASLMLKGKIETRKYKTNVRGKVLICATKNPYKREEVIKLSGENIEAVIDEILKGDEVPNGVAIAIGDLVDCRPMTKADEGKCFVTFRPELWCWVFENVKEIEQFEIPGKQGWAILTEEDKAKIKIKLA